MSSLQPPAPPTAPNHEYVEAVLEHAQSAFWQTVAVAFPEVTSGDFPSDADATFGEASRDALRVWLTANHPAYDRLAIK